MGERFLTLAYGPIYHFLKHAPETWAGDDINFLDTTLLYNDDFAQ